MFLSSSSTSACMPSAIAAAFMPETPAPMTTTLAAYTPETPPISTPRPPPERIRWYAPTCGASRPATSDIGASSGSDRSGQLHRLVRDAGDPAVQQRVGALLGRGQVQVGEEHLALAHPVVLLGDRLLDLEHQVGRRPTRRRRWAGSWRRRAANSSSVMDEPAPAPASTKTSWPARTNSCTPAGVIATRYSWFLTSRGIADLHVGSLDPPARPPVVTASTIAPGG